VSLPVIVVGAGGHAKVLLDALREKSMKVIGLTDADPARKGSTVLGFDVLGTDEVLGRFPPAEAMLVNGLGSIRDTAARRRLYEKLKAMGYRFATIVHPAAWVSSSSRLGEGVQIMAGAVVQSDCAIGDDSIINSAASVDHDCYVGLHVHIAPGVTLSGGVRVGDGCLIGAGSTVVQGVEIGKDSTVGAGSVVLKHVTAGHIVAGVPAARLKA
jgi:UDP-perosamine 4-acetyltransferase